VSDSKAVPDLIAILASAPGEITRTSVLVALAEKIKDPRAVPILAGQLSREDSSYLALEGLKNITHEKAFTPSMSSNTQKYEWRSAMQTLVGAKGEVSILGQKLAFP